MDLQLTGKVALITGASQGIGRAIALRLAAEGMSLAIAARNKSALDTLAAEIQSAPTASPCPIASLIHPCDLSLPHSPAAFVDAALARFGKIDLLVNNAGATKRGDFLALSEQDWLDGYQLKFFGAVRLSRAAWPHLATSRGSIINIAGVGGRAGNSDFTIGGSVNAALSHLTKSLADRGFHDLVRVNAINPGYIQTDRLTARIQRLAKENNLTEQQAAQKILEVAGITRFGTPAEVAALVAFIASPHANYLQGAIIDLDGGLTRGL